MLLMIDSIQRNDPKSMYNVVVDVAVVLPTK